MPNVAVFVHIHDQYRVVNRYIEGAKLNYDRYLKKALGDDGNLIRAIAYGIHIDDQSEPFINALKSIGYEVKYKPVRIINGKPDPRHTDLYLEMTIDMIKMIPKVDTIVIGSPNPDFIPVIQYLQQHGVKCIVFSHIINRELREAADSYTFIKDDLLDVKNYEDSESSNTEQ